MRCLYCGKELALLKRWTGGGDFCSDAHKQSYQEEYNRLALSRLLQAQKGHQGSTTAPPPKAGPPQSSVALEEPEPHRGTPEAADQASKVVEAPVAQPEPEDHRETETETLEAAEFSDHAAGTGEEAKQNGIEEPTVEAEPEPHDSAGFLFQTFTFAALPDPALQMESWRDVQTHPAFSEWQTQIGTVALDSADLLSLHLLPNASTIEAGRFLEALSPQVVSSTQSQPVLSAALIPGKSDNGNRLAAQAPLVIEIDPIAAVMTADDRLVRAVAFETAACFDIPELLDLFPTTIDFPAEDAGVIIPATRRDTVTDAGQVQTEPESVSADSIDESPRSSLEALARMHQETAEVEPGEPAIEPPARPQSPAVEAAAPDAPLPAVETAAALQSHATESAAPDAPVPVPEVEKPTPEAAANEPAPVAEPSPSPVDQQPETPAAPPEPTPEPRPANFATDLFDVSIRTFPPAKPALVTGDAVSGQDVPLIPQLKSLPLRPKVALAPGYKPPSGGPSEPKPETKPAAPTQGPARTANPSKPATSGQHQAPASQAKQSAGVAKAPERAAGKPAETRAPATTKPVAAKPDASKPDAAKPQAKPAASQPKAASSPVKPAQEAAATRANATDAAPKPKQPEKDRPKAAAASETASSKAKTEKSTTDAPRRSEERPKVEPANDDPVPTFGIAQPSGGPWLTPLKIKLAIGIVLLVVTCVYFFGWGGKSSKPAGSDAVTADGSGPSIIIGEGGWVEGWAGDPTNLHAGRQITIYRPSLKLSDYRLSFQGTIDTKSLGWVFRASDPQNYYAMKLTEVSSGLSPKVELFKYLVANGRQTQVGRVPIDVPVHQDTVFDIRVDVRGAQFTTYIQGQQVDTWTDDQLKTGGAGFMNEREERGKVKLVSIRYLTGATK